ncbi:MAG: hypothetical protein M3P34_10255 [Actinomycetota bacterium]|nr:hypothetical protein [Actinomycetota bacterium]
MADGARSPDMANPVQRTPSDLPDRFSLAMVKLGDRSLWGDEAFGVAVARAPTGQLWRVLVGGQAKHGLLLPAPSPWIGFGISEATERVLSVLAAVASVGFLYGLAARGAILAATRSGAEELEHRACAGLEVRVLEPLPRPE